LASVGFLKSIVLNLCPAISINCELNGASGNFPRLCGMMAIRMLALTVLIAVTARADVWIESPLVRVFPDTVPTKSSPNEIRLHAARGESESLQVCVRTDEQPMDITEVDAQGLGKYVPPPECRWVGYVQIPAIPSRNPASRGLWPDPLLDFAPVTVAPNQTCALWVTYRVPQTAKPGAYSGKISLAPREGRPKTVFVNLTVFDFEIPEKPSLRTAFTLDREAVRRMYGIDDTDLDAWRPIYDAFSNARISYRVWDGGPLVAIDRNDSSADATVFKQHLEYAVSRAHMNAIDIGASEKGTSPFPLPAKGSTQDPLQFYLHDMCDWLKGRGWLPYAFVEPGMVRERAGWQNVREACFRAKRNDDRIKRFLAGPVLPFFERYADIWATSLGQFDAHAAALLRAGRSLAVPQPWPATSVTASSSGDIPGLDNVDTQASDGYDGGLFTYWLSGREPSKNKPEWLQVELANEVNTDKLTIVWRRGFEATNVRVLVRKGNHWTALANLRWEEYPPEAAFTQSWARATLSEIATFSSIRFEFMQTSGGTPVGVTELLFGVPPAVEPEKTIVAEPWLASQEGCFPSLGVDANPIEARLFPWVCFGHRVGGFLHRGLNDWPAEWAAFTKSPPAVWPARDSCANVLFYPGPKAPIPSIRSELLRDGMEDYEYLLALDRIIAEQYMQAQPLRSLAAPHFYSPIPAPEELKRLSRAILEERTKVGFVLSSNAKKGRP